MERCGRQRVAGEDRALDPSFWQAALEEIGARGQRTLAFAVGALRDGQRTLDFGDVEGGLTLLGVTGMMDPPRREAVEAVRRCRSAGISVKMITGDHAVTARAIAASMGIGGDGPAMTGVDLEQTPDEPLRERAVRTDVFARVSPEHKLRLVKALQAGGEVVAMTGDGVNDAPALKRADVGVAMGIKGTEAAKEASEMVLVDDNFASITHAVEEGRRVYDNIKKSILFILPTNGGEAFTILAAIALGRMLPVTAVQILWVNMITAVTLALSLVFEPAEPGVMRRPPRETDAPLLSGFMIWRILFVSLIMVVGTFGLFIWERSQGTDIAAARTVAVNMLVVFEAYYLLSTRYLLDPVLNARGLLGNPKVPLSIVLVMLFQLLFTYAPPMQLFFGSAPIDGAAWGRILVIGVSVLVLVELEKAVLRVLHRRV
jgi:magnesium-transporting ATPase (P-type)